MRNLLFSWIAGLFLIPLPVAFGATPEAVPNDLPASIQQACQADLSQFCKDITAGEGRVAACLKAHDDKISAGCKQVIQTHEKAMTDFMQSLDTACSGDIQKFCQASTEIQDVLKCLGTNVSGLAPECKTFTQSNPQVPS